MNRTEDTAVTSVRDRSALSVGSARSRRRYSAEEKKAILAEASAPGATVTEVSRRHDITRGLIHNWRREEAGSLLGATVRFAPVTVAQSTPKALEAPAKTETGGRFAEQSPGQI